MKKYALHKPQSYETNTLFTTSEFLYEKIEVETLITKSSLLISTFYQLSFNFWTIYLDILTFVFELVDHFFFLKKKKKNLWTIFKYIGRLLVVYGMIQYNTVTVWLPCCIVVVRYLKPRQTKTENRPKQVSCNENVQSRQLIRSSAVQLLIVHYTHAFLSLYTLSFLCSMGLTLVKASNIFILC